jgi:ribosome-associated toxin RatA of RatAB toxin-antitoxin module
VNTACPVGVVRMRAGTGSKEKPAFFLARTKTVLPMNKSGASWRPVVRAVMGLCSVGLLALAAVVVGPVAAQAGNEVAVSDKVRGGGIDSTGHPYPGTSTEWGRAVAIVDAPFDRVLGVVHDYAGYKDFLPNFETSRVLSKRGSSALIYAQVSVMHGTAKIWAELKITERPGSGATRTIEAKMMKGNVDLLQAVWEVTPYDANRTLVSFQIIVDPDLPLPSSFVNAENMKTARKTIRALRERFAPIAAPKK